MLRAGGGYKGGFCENLSETSVRSPAEPMPSGSRMDLLLAEAESISDGSNASVITYVRRKKITAQM